MDTVGIILPVGAIMLAVIPELIILQTLKQAKRIKSQHVSITEHGLTTATTTSTVSHDWAAFPSARETPKFWLLKCPGGGSMALPKEKFSAEESDWFEALLRRHGLLKS